MAKACLIAPGVELSPVLKLVAAAKPLEANRALGDDFKFVEGLAEYRQQHLAAAASWLGKIDLPEGQSWRAVQIDMVLAMTQWRLGREENARATFAKALHLAESDLPKAKVRDLGPAWIDHVIANALRHEAEQMMAKPER